MTGCGTEHRQRGVRWAVWVVGEPAAGKSTVTRNILGDRRSNLTLGAQRWCLSAEGWVAPGHYKGETFDGADKVGMSQARAYLDQYLGAPARLGILLDGARFSTRPCFDLLAKTHATAVYYVAEDPEVCATRRRERDWHPSASWLKGAVTRAERFRDYAVAHGAKVLP